MRPPTGSGSLPPAKGVARLFLDQAEDVGQRDQPRVRDGAREEGLGDSRRICRGTAQWTDSLRTRPTRCYRTSFCADLSSSLRDPESVAQRNPCEHGRGHGSKSREVCQARSLPRQNEAVVDVETVAHRPQGVASGGKLAIQRNNDAVPEDGHGRYQRPQHIHEITDLLAPNDSGKLYSAIECKAAGWAVMDADTRLSDSTTGAGKGAKGDHKGVYSVNITPKALALVETSADSRTKVQIRSPAARGGKGKRANNEKDRCKRYGKITNPPHWAKIVSGGFFFYASCVDITPSFVIIGSGTAWVYLPLRTTVQTRKTC